MSHSKLTGFPEMFYLYQTEECEPHLAAERNNNKCIKEETDCTFSAVGYQPLFL
jgi:hypothetical protein